jgi:uncharacterized protein involved in response to NO
LGILCGFLGVGAWLSFFAGFTPYPLPAHSFVMPLGFFLSFVSGFLMTALPRMSGTWQAGGIERALAIGFISLGVIFAFLQWIQLASLCAFLQCAFLAIFAIRRMRSRKSSPPTGMIFVPVALAWAMYGALSGALGASSEMARVALQEAFLLNLIVGLGGRLIPFLTHVQDISPMERAAEPARPIWAVFFLLNLSLLIEGFGFQRPGWALRALVLTLAAVFMFKLHRGRRQSSHAGFALRASVLMMIAGYVMLAIFPAYRLALLHLIFIGGFTLMTVMVATRVILSHGGFSLELERKSLFVAAAAILLVVAAIARGFYFLPAAAAVWLVAVALWFQGIGRLIFR